LHERCRPEGAVAAEVVVQRRVLPWQQSISQELTIRKAENVVRRWQVIFKGFL
jgi:hypothetical protein